MTHSEEQFENYLQEFQPRRPCALRLPQTRRLNWVPRLAAAAILVFGLAISIWFSFHSTHHSGPPHRANNKSLRPTQTAHSPFALTREAVENPDHLDTLLEAIPSHQLPRFDEDHSALHVLATE